MENLEYKANLLEAVIVLSQAEKIPAQNEFVLSELVNGTIEYIGGDAGKIDFQSFRDEIRRLGNVVDPFEVDPFELVLSNYLNSEIRAHPEATISPKVRDSLVQLCRFRPFSKSHNTEFYVILSSMRGCNYPLSIESSFLLPYQSVKKVQNEIIPTLPETDKKDIEGIGKAMRKYIERDLEYIRKAYL